MNAIALITLVALVTAAAPVVHRLSPDAAAAAIAAGAEANRAADALAAARGDPALALPLERDKRLHGEAGIAFGSNGGREVFGEVETGSGDHATARLGYDGTLFGRSRYRNR